MPVYPISISPPTILLCSYLCACAAPARSCRRWCSDSPLVCAVGTQRSRSLNTPCQRHNTHPTHTHFDSLIITGRGLKGTSTRKCCGAAHCAPLFQTLGVLRISIQRAGGKTPTGARGTKLQSRQRSKQQQQNLPALVISVILSDIRSVCLQL